MKMTLMLSAVLITGLAYLSGCTPQASAPPAAPVSTVKTDEHDHDHDKHDDHDKHAHDDHDHDEHASTDKKDGKKGTDHDHSGWWCAEHGVPEKQCSQCFPKVAAEFQKKGDWCAEHDRAKSQCFICDPSLKEKFAAQYRAKEGKEPPALKEEEAKEDKKS